MLLCVDTTALETSAEVQKAVKLEEIINNHTKYYDTEEEALKDKYVPLNFCISIRSIYSNRVVQTTKEDGNKIYYTNVTDIQPFPHKGYDLIMYLSSICVMHNVDYKNGFDDLMFKHSQFSPMGLYNPDPFIINPIIYTHIIISDDSIEELAQYLKEDREIVNISDMKREGCISALLDTLIIVKEDKSNATDNDNEERI